MLACPDCLTVICPNCRDQAHLGFTCKENAEHHFKEWEIFYCPKCKVKVEKEEGCNHMKCLICEYEFCWVCGNAYSNYHFLPFNPMGCSSGYYTPRRSLCTRLLLKLLYIVLFLIMFPLMLVFLMPCYFGFAGCTQTFKFLKRYLTRDDSYMHSHNTSCRKALVLFGVGTIAVIAGVVSFAVGVLVNFVVAPVFLVIFVFCMMPYFFFIECTEARRNH